MTFGLSCLVLLSLVAAGQKLTRASDQIFTTEPLSILVGSHGHMLPIATMEGSADRFDDAIAIGDLLLTHPRAGDGLRVAMLKPGLELDSFNTYKSATDPDASLKLKLRLSLLPVGSVVIAAVHGYVHPPDEKLEGLDDFPLTLGAELTPFRATAASWAIISYKLDSGWRTIAEAYSESRGVHLAFTLSPDPSVYEHHHSEVFFSESEGVRVVEFFASFRSAASKTRDVVQSKWAAVGGVKAPSLLVRPSPDESSVIRWEHVTIGPNAVFQAKLSQKSAPRPNQGLPKFSVIVDGEEVGSFSPSGAIHRSWSDWSFPLDNLESGTVDIEFRTDLANEGLATSFLWGNPTIEWGGDS